MNETKQFDFNNYKLSADKELSFTLSPTGGYLNASASRMFLEKGEYITIGADPAHQAIEIKTQDKPGSGVYKIFNPQGNPIQVRQKLARIGMKEGLYLHLADGVFQHIDHLTD